VYVVWRIRKTGGKALESKKINRPGQEINSAMTSSFPAYQAGP
jgi:hypothetical protein